MTACGERSFMQAWVFSGQTRFMHGIHSKFRCKIRAFLFCHGLVSNVNLMDKSLTVVKTRVKFDDIYAVEVVS